MGVYSQLTREEIISWLRERQSHWMTQNYNRAAAMLEAEAAENETLREWHLSSQAEIARLQAEIERLVKAHHAASDRAMRSEMMLITAHNDALEEAAAHCHDSQYPDGYDLAEEIRALKRQ